MRECWLALGWTSPARLLLSPAIVICLGHGFLGGSGWTTRGGLAAGAAVAATLLAAGVGVAVTQPAITPQLLTPPARAAGAAS